MLNLRKYDKNQAIQKYIATQKAVRPCRWKRIGIDSTR